MDELGRYLKDIEEFPDFREDPEGVSILVEKMRAGDEYARLSLIEATLKYILKLATAHCRRWSVWHHLLDLVQEANTEVSEEIEKYDPAKASLEDFIGYRAYIAFVRFWHKSKTIHTTDYGRKIVKNLQRARVELTAALGREPTLEELSKRVGREESDVEALQKHPDVTMVSFSDEAGDDGDVGKAIDLDSLTDAEFDPLRLIQAGRLRDLLIECLGAEDADLLLTYYDLGSDGFRTLFFQIKGKEINTDAARKGKERLLKRLKNCPQAKERLFDRGGIL